LKYEASDKTKDLGNERAMCAAGRLLRIRTSKGSRKLQRHGACKHLSMTHSIARLVL